MGSLGVTNCFFISAQGSDTNAGTSESSPWLHAPGMPSCSNTCAATTPAAGQGFIFRGGDTWHIHSGSPGTGGSISWSRGGASGSPIYIGVDQAWFSGSAWARPILHQDNPLSKSAVGSCKFDGTNSDTISLSGNFTILDNLEFTGYCWSGNPSFSDHTIGIYGNNVTVSRVYIHGWTHTSGALDQAYMVLVGNGHSGSVFANSVVDGSDSPPASGFALYYICNDVHGNVFRNLSNAAVCLDLTQLHDNLFEHIDESFDNTTHGNVVEWNGTAGPIHSYNNVVRHTTVAVTFWLWLDNNSSAYFYNNIFYDIKDSGTVNCINISGGGGGGESAFIYNNTINGSCAVRFATNSVTPCFSGTTTFSNNQFIGYGSLSGVYDLDSGCKPTITDAGGNIFQSTATAASQGYISSSTGYCANDTSPCAPTSSSTATVGTGKNNTGSCSTLGSALCSSTTLAVSEGPSNNAIYPRETNKRSTSKRCLGHWGISKQRRYCDLASAANESKSGRPVAALRA